MKNSYLRKLILCVSAFIVSAAGVVNAVPARFLDNYKITCYTMDDGLANNHIDDIYMDSKGFLWVAFMGGGLSRFDGYDFVNFNENTGNRHIKSGFVSGIVEDGFGRLWVAGEGGLDVIDLSTMSIVVPGDATGKYAELAVRGLTDVVIDSKGALWAGGSQMLTRVVFDADGNIAGATTIPVAGAYHRGMPVRDIDADGEVWTGISGTVCKVRIGADGSLTPMAVSKSLSNLAEVEYFSDFVAKDGQVWISTNHGLYRYDPASDMVKSYLSDLSDAGTLSQNFLTDIAVTRNNRLVVSSLRGLNVYNPMNDTFERTCDDRRNLNNQFVNMMRVAGDQIFIGTEGGGINVLSPLRIDIWTPARDGSEPQSISSNPVNAIVEGRDGTLWIGTVEGGLNVRRPGDSRFRHITTAGNVLSHNSVSALAYDGDERMWVGTWGGGVDVLSTHEPYRDVMHINQQAGYEPNISFVGTLAYDSINDGMFIGSNGGLLFYDCRTGRLSAALKTGSDFAAFGFVGSHVDGNDRLWMGSAGGLLIIDLKRRLADGTFAYEYIKHRLDDPASGVMERPSCFYESADGSMWIGTNGHGFYHGVPEPSTGRMSYTNYTTADGLANNTVRGIVGDDSGCLWISTINGLSCFDVAHRHFTNYDVSDGLPDNQFYWNAACRMADGRIMLGTTRGVVDVWPDGYESHHEAFRVVFTRLRVGNHPVTVADCRIIDRDIAYADRIELHESDKSLEVEFSALDYDRTGNAVYSYRLKGFDNDWIIARPDRRWASYTNLSPGKYVMQVKYLPEGNDPDAPVTELEVVVRPYFYKSMWFMILSALIFGALVVFLYKMRINGLKAQRRRLRQEIEKRTAQLAEQKQLVERRANELADRNEQLQAQNEEISRQKMQLTEMNRRVNKMTMDRIQFFTSITHEFRTPITLIIGPIERALKLSTNPKVIEQLHFVERNSKYLLTLVNQLMDFRKVESGKMEISYSRGNLRQFVGEVVTPFLPLAADRGITVRCLFRLADDMAVYDEESLRKIIINLLSNAIKYTPDNGRVTIYLAYMYGRGEESSTGTFYLGVSDTGSGVDEADKPHIFDRFYQGESKLKYPMPGAGDSGIGLYLCRTIVELHGAAITVKNNHGAGCTFRVVGPIPKIDSEHAPQALSAHDETEMIPPYSLDNQHDNVVLVVEDNDDMRSFICSILRDSYSLLEARNGVEALKILSETNVDFIISDLMMPEMDGVELSRRVKENFAISHIPFLMLTAKTATESRIDSYRIGVDDYLLKPFDERVLLARIEGILRTRRLLQHNFSDSMDSAALDIAAESRDKKFVDQVMETIKQNYRNSYFEVGDFAEALGISRSLLNKKLQSLLGQSAGQLVRNYRLNMARELIMKNRETRAMNISEIAYEVGFNDSKYFTRCFTRQFNITPSGMLNS